ncbi:hypothetical protein HIM_04811 [Hirsutella minnesotensis 3608]|uniref:Sec39 domain-containing protein n=1 Tax=Hirsutella minnesotensis 3608 TaxID=1043627 RepID=A0A0F8A5N8_9HYPO|nr:hypothetical protein HIM_04811 [Hirsutella minnesotensis 3608]
MTAALTPAKVLLLAVHLTTHGDVAGLAQLHNDHPGVLRKDFLLRILLTHLPETVNPVEYVGILKAVDTEESAPQPQSSLDISPVSALSETQATKKANKLHLVPLQCPDALRGEPDDHLASFLYQRACRMDAESGMLAQLPDLLVPFLDHSTALGNWIITTVLPFVRRNVEFYAEITPTYSLAQFQNLAGPQAVRYLLARSIDVKDDSSHLARDLKGLIAPWLHDCSRWVQSGSNPNSDVGALDPSSSVSCPGWEQVLQWLIDQAAVSWEAVADAIQQWGGPTDANFGYDTLLELPEPRQSYLEQTYARALLAASYMMQEATFDSLAISYRMCTKGEMLMGHECDGRPLPEVLSSLSDTVSIDIPHLDGSRAASSLRSDLLQAHNPLTSPTQEAVSLLKALILSASVFTLIGVPCTVRKAADLAFIRDEKEQKSQITKLFHSLSNSLQSKDDEFWMRSRRDIVWLRDWGREAENSNPNPIKGVIATITRQYVERETLRSLLAKSRFSLARRLYEDGTETPLQPDVIQDVVFHSALGAFDNVSDAKRARGGLKHCNDILNSMPLTVSTTLPGSRRIQALLRATHALSDYRLVLKQGEEFSPVVLRVHSDPISIIEKVLQQNSKAYTRLQEFLEMGANMVRAGLLSRERSVLAQDFEMDDLDAQLFVAERRIVSMCIEAALREDDFETAYSYVVSRLAVLEPGKAQALDDKWSWQAALKAGLYLRTERSQLPTHLGTASGNPEIRHFEQRIECLATALRVAPTCQLQDILKSFRRCEEQLDSAIKEEAANEAAWEARGDWGDIPGTFDAQGPALGAAQSTRNMSASAAARQADEAPMSLFDLSRATARVAQRNLNVLSSLQGLAAGESAETSEASEPSKDRIRKRDQIREAATGTLVSGVGWLIGANVNQGHSGTG